MIVFQVKGQSHRLSTLKCKEKDVITKNSSTYSTKYIKDTEVLGRQLSQARSKPDPVALTTFVAGFAGLMSHLT